MLITRKSGKFGTDVQNVRAPYALYQTRNPSPRDAPKIFLRNTIKFHQTTTTKNLGGGVSLGTHLFVKVP